jgi:hypothetical protein
MATILWTGLGPESELVRVLMRGNRRLGTHTAPSSILTAVPGRGNRAQASRLADRIARVLPRCYALNMGSIQLQYTCRVLLRQTDWFILLISSVGGFYNDVTTQSTSRQAKCRVTNRTKVVMQTAQACRRLQQ